MAVRFINGVPVQGGVPGITVPRVAGPPTRSGRRPTANPKPVRAPRARPAPRRVTPPARPAPGVTAPRVAGPPTRSGRRPTLNPRPVRRRQVPLRRGVRGGEFEDALRENRGQSTDTARLRERDFGLRGIDPVEANPLLNAGGGDGPIGDYFKNYFLPSAAGFLLGPAVAGTEAIRGVGEAGLGGALDYAIPDDYQGPGFAGTLIRALNAQGKNLRGQGIERVQRIGTGVKDAYATKYWDPVRRGDIGQLLENMGKDPFGTAGDAAAAWAVAGGVTRLGARGAGRAGLGREGGLIQRASDVSILSPTEARQAGRARQGARYRPPREVTVPLNDEAIGGPTLRVARDRRPMSRNPLTRELIQRPAMRVADRSRARRAVRADDIALDNPNARVFMDRGVPRSVRRNTSAGQAERLVTKNARELRYDAEIDRDYWMAQNVDRAIRDLGNLDQPRTAGGLIAARTAERGRRATPGTSPEQVAWRLHHEGLIPKDLAGKTPGEIRELIVRNAEAANRGYEARSRNANVKPRTRYTKEFIQAIREVPDHLIDLSAKVGDPKRGVGRDLSPAGQQARVRAAVESTRDLSRAETQALVDAKILTPEQAAARNTLPSRMLLGGAQYGPNVVARVRTNVGRAFTRARELEAEARAAREAGDEASAARIGKQAERWKEIGRRLRGRADDVLVGTAQRTDKLNALLEDVAKTEAALKAARDRYDALPAGVRGASEFQAGRQFGRGEERVSGSPKTRTVNKRVPLMPAGPEDLAGRRVNYKAPGVKGIRVSAKRRSGLLNQALAEGKRYTTRVRREREAAVRSAERDARNARMRARKEAERNPGFTEPKRPELVSEGAYLRHVPADKRAGDTPPPGGGGGLIASDMKPSSGSLVRRANIDNDPRLVVQQAQHVANRAVGPQSARFLNNLIDQIAFKDKDGNPVTAARQDLVRAADPDRVAFVNVGRLRNATRELDDLDPGQGIDVTATGVVIEGQKTDGGMKLTLPKGAKASDYVAVSKPALDEWVNLMKNPGSLVTKYDNLLAIWKGGLLAFSPRWYVNNFLGVGSQFMLLTTGDVRSIFQANRKLRGAVERSYKGVAENTLSMDVGMQPGVGYGNLRRAEAAGFRFNNRMEGLFRRGAYFSRVKKILRDEGYRGLNKMSPEEWGRLLDNLPMSVKKQAIREFELFLGDFRRFTWTERNVLKRIVPFYSWFRVITRLTFTMPFRNPLRWQALNVLRQAYDQVYANEDRQRMPSDQGSINVGANGIIGTRYANPFGTPYGFLEAMGSGNVADIGNEALGWLTPAAQAPLRYLFPELGGNFIVTTPGSGGAMDAFGLDPTVGNSVTGQYTQATPRRAVTDALLESVLPWTRNIRTVLANGREPYADVPTFPIPTSPDDVFNLLSGRGAPRSLVTGRNDDRLYQPDRERASRAINPWLGILGIPLKREDRDARDARLAKQAKRVRDAWKATNKKRAQMGLPELPEPSFWWER